MNSIAIFILLLLLLLAALGLGVYFGLKRNVVQTSVRAGMIVFSIILSAILAATLTPTIFKSMISLFNSFFGSETLSYLAGDTDGASGILSFMYALAAPFTFFMFFFIITLALVGVYNFLCRFYITDEKLAEWAERKKAKENGGDKSDENADEVKEETPEEEKGGEQTVSAEEAIDVEDVAASNPDALDYETAEENAAEEAPSDEFSAEEVAAKENADGAEEPEVEVINLSGEPVPVDSKKSDAEKEGDKDKKEKKELPPKAKRAILVAANALCSLILAVAMVVPTTSLISACSGLIEAAGGERSAQDYVDEINTNEDTTEAKEFITQITKISSNPIYNIYRVLGIPVVYSITGVQVGDSQRQPLSQALISSEDLICSMLELMANADLLSTKVTWPEYADILYDASEGVEEAPYWNKLLGSFLSDASLRWEEGDSFMGLEPPFAESMADYDEVLEKDIYKILSENNTASLEFKSVANALNLMSAIACVEEANFDSASALCALMKNITDESAEVVKEYITDDLLLSLDYTEDELPFYKTVYVSVLEDALQVSKAEYADEAARKAAYSAEADNIVAFLEFADNLQSTLETYKDGIPFYKEVYVSFLDSALTVASEEYSDDKARKAAYTAEAENAETFLKFTADPDSVANNEFILAYVNSVVVQAAIKDVTDSGKINDPAGIVDRLGGRSATLKDSIDLLENLTTLTKAQCDYAIAYVTK